MSAVIWALVSAFAYGAYDFIGGAVSRRTSAWSVAFVVLCSNALTLTLAAPWFSGAPSVVDVVWGITGGMASGAGVSLLFRGLGTGRMGVVTPVAGVGGAVLPGVVGVALGERLGILVLLGLLVGVPAIWLIASGEVDPHSAGERRPGSRSRAVPGLVDGCLAGAGFAGAYVAIGQIGADAGLWPLAAMQATSAACVPLLAVALGAAVRPLDGLAWRAWYAGPIGASAAVSFYLATSDGMLTVSSVLSSLHPAVTVLLAVALLRERVTPKQAGGLVLALVCVVCVVAG